jgi:ATP-binding cassette subfamily B protein
MSEQNNKHSRSPQRQGGGMMGRGGPGAMMPGEKAKNFRGTLKNLMAYLNRYMPAIVVCLILAVGSTVFAILGPKILAGATDELFGGLLEMITGADTNVDGVVGINFTIILNVLLFCGGIYVVSAILNYVQGFILAGIATRVSYRMRGEISEKINRLPLSYFDRASHGEVLSRITNDVDTLTQTLNQSLPQMVSSITTLIGTLIMMLTINVWMTLITLLVLPISLVVVTQVVKRSQPYYQSQQKYLGEANGQVEEMYGGHLVVKAFNHEEESEREFDAVNEKLYSSAWKSQFWGGMMMPLMNFVGNIGYVLVCIMGGFFTLSGSITVGDIQAFIQYVRNFTQPITQIANSSNVLQQTAAAAERVFEFLNETEETPDTTEPVDHVDVEGSVYFAHVNFGYLPEKTIINDFSAIIQPGRQVAIVGPTGAGKTTMVKLLMRFYDVNNGAILVDGYDVKQFARNGLRGMFGMVLQDTWLYNDTIMENIRYGRLDATGEEVIAAAKAAQAHRFIRTLPDGYNMVLNEEASNISAGQKQLLTIARTILSDPKILILDEATSSVDTRTEMSIQKAMANLMRGRTSFVIAHRLSTIRDADMILVMRNGDIVETGTHHELLAKGGFYAHLYNSQFESGEIA